MLEMYKKVVFENYANFSGRARRREYWMFALLHIIISVILALIDKFLNFTFSNGQMGILRSIYNLIVFVPSLAVGFRRLHDIGKSGWLLIIFQILAVCATFTLVFLLLRIGYYEGDEYTFFLFLMVLAAVIILVVVIWLLVLFCKEGDKGVNQYGDDPKNQLEEPHEI